MRVLNSIERKRTIKRSLDNFLGHYVEFSGQGIFKSVILAITKLYKKNTAVPLTARDMNWAYPAMTISRMDAGVEPPWMVQELSTWGASLLGVTDSCLDCN